MGGLFESEEATAPRVRVSWLPLVRRLVLAVFAWEASGDFRTKEAIDYVVQWLAGGQVFCVSPVASLLLEVFALLVAGNALLMVARLVQDRPRLPRAPATARVDQTGLHVGDRLVVARADVARVAVATDADLGFALVVTTRRGATVRIAQRTEGSARGLAAALAPVPLEPGSVVFEGISGGRSRETRAAGLAGAAVLGTLALTMILGWAVGSPSAWGWFDGWRAEIPFTAAWWLGLVASLGMLPVGIALAAALGTIVRRLRPGTVTVGPAGVETADGTIAANAIAGAEPGATSEVTLALRDGKTMRLAFAADRPVVERDLFVARVRAMMAGTPEPSYSAAETSGVRVAVRPDEGPVAEDDADDHADDADIEPQAPRARRR